MGEKISEIDLKNNITSDTSVVVTPPPPDDEIENSNDLEIADENLEQKPVEEMDQTVSNVPPPPPSLPKDCIIEMQMMNKNSINNGNAGIENGKKSEESTLELSEYNNKKNNLENHATDTTTAVIETNAVENKDQRQIKTIPWGMCHCILFLLVILAFGTWAVLYFDIGGYKLWKKFQDFIKSHLN